MLIRPLWFATTVCMGCAGSEGVTGACDAFVDAETCTEFDDVEGASEADLAAECNKGGYTDLAPGAWKAGGSCPTEGVIARCVDDQEGGGTTTHLYYSGFGDLSLEKGLCEASASRWEE